MTDAMMDGGILAAWDRYSFRIAILWVYVVTFVSVQDRFRVVSAEDKTDATVGYDIGYLGSIFYEDCDSIGVLG